jgi:membrane protease YdiL (CAAX protease family)
MTTIKALIKSHPVLSYFVLTFAISWGAILIAVGLGPGGFSATPQQFQMSVPYAVPAMILGPGVAGIFMTGFLYGRAGLGEFRSRLLKWRVGARWYAVALLTAPFSIMAALLALSLVSPEYLPTILTTSDKVSLLLQGIVGTFVGGIFEELGWTGFATHTLLRRMRHGVLATGLFVGVLWGVAHLPLYYWGGKRRSLRSVPTSRRGRECPRLVPALQGFDGVGLRSYREPALGDAHARECHRQPSDLGFSGGDGLVYLYPRIRRSAVGRRWSGRLGQRWAPLAPIPTTTTEAGGLSKGGRSPGTGGRSYPKGG